MFASMSYGTTEYGSLRAGGTPPAPVRIFSKHVSILSTILEKHYIPQVIPQKSIARIAQGESNVVQLKSNTPHVLGTRNSMHITQ